MKKKDSLEQEIDTLLHGINKKIQSTVKNTKSFLSDLTLLQVQALKFIHFNKTATTTDLARLFQVSKPSASALVERLVENGWIKRTSHAADRRTIILTLTRKGSQRLNGICEKRVSLLKTLFRSLSMVEKETLVRILKKMNDTLK